MKQRIFLLLVLVICTFQVLAAGWVEGIPISVQKTDYSNLHLIYIEMESPVDTTAACTSKAGVVIEDSNESSKSALTMAMTALTTGKTFRCYMNSDRCSSITGAAVTYPVCDYYPTLVR